jgi:uncharacterized protein YjbI with pentapeptide repeats
VLIAVIFYFGESGDRLKQKHYQAWQVINTAQGKGGNGGRIEALQELNADGIPLVGVDVSGGFLQGIHLQSARLSRSNFSAADVRNSNLNSADMSDANLRSANFRESTLRNAHFERADLTEADLSGADLGGADLSGTILTHADLRDTNLTNLKWHDVLNLKNANIFGVKNAPEGFVAYALKRGAIQIESDNQ